jgi:hypothetical protein
VSDYRLHDQGSIPGKGKDFSCQTSSEVPRDSCPIGIGGPFPAINRDRGVMLTTHPRLVPRSRMRSYISSIYWRLHDCSGTASLNIYECVCCYNRYQSNAVKRFWVLRDNTRSLLKDAIQITRRPWKHGVVKMTAFWNIAPLPSGRLIALIIVCSLYNDAYSSSGYIVYHDKWMKNWEGCRRKKS